MNLEEWRKNVLEGISERHKDAWKRIDEATKCIEENDKRIEDTIKEIDALLESMKNN